MQQNTLRFRHGTYDFSISTESISTTTLKQKLLSATRQQFSAFSQIENSVREPFLAFVFCEKIEPFFPYAHYRNIGNVKYADDTLFFDYAGIRFVAKRKNKGFKVFFEISQRSSIRSNFRLLKKEFYDQIELQVSLFYYRIFLTFTHLANAFNNLAYIHGATVADTNGEAILFPADSGVGKSSMLFRMAQERGYFYIADDLSIVSPNAESYFSGRSISTKPYHLKNFPFLKNLINQEMPYMQKLQWKILQDNRLVYGINPKKLFEGKVFEKAIVKKVVHLVNTNRDDFILQACDTSTLCKASSNILMNELILVNQILYKALSIPENNLFPSPIDIAKSYESIYQSIFSKSENYLLEVPYHSHPNKMYDFLKASKIL